MKFLSMKEISALVELMVGGLSIYNYFLTDLFDEKLLDLALFKHRCICISLAFMSFFYALGTWFWFSNIKTTKMLNRLHVEGLGLSYSEYHINLDTFFLQV